MQEAPTSGENSKLLNGTKQKTRSHLPQLNHINLDNDPTFNDLQSKRSSKV